MLNQILFPLSQDEFFRTYWTRNFVHIPGQADKFAHFFPWDVLNRALEEHRFDSHRLGMVKAGKRLDAVRYLSGGVVNAAGLAAELSNGATLILNSCEEIHRPLRALCFELETLFHQHVTANLYAGWRLDRGFDVHWDTQDVMILQVSGRKHWKIWKPTRPYPFRNDAVDTSAATCPKNEPLFDAILEPGGLLNIPRGWWHVAYPLDEPCLHLTVTIQNLNGIDMLHWLADFMKTSDSARMELPIVATSAERLEWLDRVRADLMSAFDYTIIDRYLTGVDTKAVPRPRVSLPLEADARQNAITRTTLLELAGARPIHFVADSETTICHSGGVDWPLDTDVAERLKAFNDGQPHSMADLIPRPDLRVSAAVGLLLMKGVLRRA